VKPIQETDMKTYITHVAANTVDGVFVIDPVDYPDAEFVGFNYFFSSLPDMQDGEQLFCAVDPDQLALLEGDYSCTLS
jgi:hypothetical protein